LNKIQLVLNVCQVGVLFKDIVLRYHGSMFIVAWWVHVAISLMLGYGHKFQNLMYFCHKMYSWLGYQKEWPIFEELQRKKLHFCLSYIILVVMHCCMPIDKMI
jgi:hypothetical protein